MSCTPYVHCAPSHAAGTCLRAYRRKSRTVQAAAPDETCGFTVTKEDPKLIAEASAKPSFLQPFFFFSKETFAETKTGTVRKLHQAFTELYEPSVSSSFRYRVARNGSLNPGSFSSQGKRLRVRLNEKVPRTGEWLQSGSVPGN